MKFLRFIAPAVLLLTLFSCGAEAETEEKEEAGVEQEVKCGDDCEKKCCAKKEECGEDCTKACCAKEDHACGDECADGCTADHSHDEAHVCDDACANGCKLKAIVKDTKKVMDNTTEIVKDVELPSKM